MDKHLLNICVWSAAHRVALFVICCFLTHLETMATLHLMSVNTSSHLSLVQRFSGYDGGAAFLAAVVCALSAGLFADILLKLADAKTREYDSIEFIVTVVLGFCETLALLPVRAMPWPLEFVIVCNIVLVACVILDVFVFAYMLQQGLGLTPLFTEKE